MYGTNGATKLKTCFPIPVIRATTSIPNYQNKADLTDNRGLQQIQICLVKKTFVKEGLLPQ